MLSDYREAGDRDGRGQRRADGAESARWWSATRGIDVFLVILVFSTALTIEPRTLRDLPAAWRRLSVALVAGITLLPALSWLAAHLVAAGHLRDGSQPSAWRPAEIASIATTAMAGGDVALAGGLLLGSTLLHRGPGRTDPGRGGLRSRRWTRGTFW